LKNEELILRENHKDIAAATKKEMSRAFLDRLTLNEKRIGKMAQALRDIVHLPDPVGEVVWGSTRPNGLRIRQVRVPLGVVLIIYEARPNVTTDAAGLCFKSGNVCILRGGSDSFHSNTILVKILTDVLKANGLPEEIITYIPFTERDAVTRLIQYNQYIDVIIPRGGEDLIQMIVEKSRIPVVYHAKGVCCAFIDESADKEMARTIVLNAKTQRPGVCNSIESLLIHKDYSGKEELVRELLSHKVEIRGDASVRSWHKDVKAVSEQDWDTEYLDLILSVREVTSTEEAIEHINRHGSHHSDTIVTQNYNHAEKFLKEVDSATVYVNASTRFTDGGEFGLGAEIGISTQKLHCRGPMGLRDLTSLKYIIYGEGQTRE
ncbi:MAG: glutamate-5-semialdehyde dehydrogenase, partial [bacterium]|nr:glutamate-5-semialdehyde dehydrogenase [bacterium]